MNKIKEYDSGVCFEILGEYGFDISLQCIALNKKMPTDDKGIERMYMVAKSLSNLGRGHNKYLEFIDVYFKCKFPRLALACMSTYRTISRSSESTTYTLLKRSIVKEDFEDCNVTKSYLNEMNEIIKSGNLKLAKQRLCESYLQTRIYKINYLSLQNIWIQRHKHSIDSIRNFCDFVINNIEHPEFINKDLKLRKDINERN